MKLKCLAAAALLCGCGAASPSQSPEIVYDACEALRVLPGADTQEPELAGVREGLLLWQRAGVTAPRLEDAAAPSELPVTFKLAAAGFHGVYEPESGQVYVNRRLSDPQERAITVAHEVGHALGLPHVPPEERTSLMNPGNLTVAPTGEDVEALARLWGKCLDVP